jgi:hypothetical protein
LLFSTGMSSLTGFPPDDEMLPVRAFISIESMRKAATNLSSEIHVKPHAGFWSGGASFFY